LISENLRKLLPRDADIVHAEFLCADALCEEVRDAVARVRKPLGKAGEEPLHEGLDERGRSFGLGDFCDVGEGGEVVADHREPRLSNGARS
jgi:hypothetical protein